MGIRINTNIIAMRAQRNLGQTSKALARAMERLSSGSRINNAGDDAAGLAVSEGLRSQVRGLQQAIRNANDGVGFLTTAEGALAEATNIAQRIRELSIQAASGAIGNNDRSNLNSEVQALLSEFDRIATQTEFNGVFLLDGSFQTTDLQVGIRKGQTISFNIGDARASSLGWMASLSGIRNLIATGVGTMNINGYPISPGSASDDTVSSGGNSYSAIAIAKAINASSSRTQVYADVLPTIVQVNYMDFSAFAGDLSTDNFKINDVPITGTNVTSVNSFIYAVNNYSQQTGVSARLQSGSTNSIEFYANDGRNIEIFFSSTSSTSALHLAFANSANMTSFSNGSIFSVTSISTSLSTNFSNVGLVRTGAIKLRSSNDITITGSGLSAALGFSATTISVSNGTRLADVDISTQSGAGDALAVIDKVLTELTNLRSGLGAVQNRLDITASRLGITSENLNAAQSQIRDADLAIETAEFTKQQILQQAGVAILGQANTTAQQALQLLRFNG